MKKVFLLLLVSFVLLTSLFACGQDEKKPEESVTPSESSVTETPSKPADESEPVESSVAEEPSSEEVSEESSNPDTGLFENDGSYKSVASYKSQITVYKDKAGKLGAVNTAKKIVLAFEYDEILDFNSKLYAKNADSCLITDYAGEILIPAGRYIKVVKCDTFFIGVISDKKSGELLRYYCEALDSKLAVSEAAGKFYSDLEVFDGSVIGCAEKTTGTYTYYRIYAESNVIKTDDYTEAHVLAPKVVELINNFVDAYAVKKDDTLMKKYMTDEFYKAYVECKGTSASDAAKEIAGELKNTLTSLDKTKKEDFTLKINPFIDISKDGMTFATLVFIGEDSEEQVTPVFCELTVICDGNGNFLVHRFFETYDA